MDTSRRIAGFKYGRYSLPIELRSQFGMSQEHRRVYVETLAYGRKGSTKDLLGFVQGIWDNYGRIKAFGYEFDNDEFHAYVHGRLPYEKLKPDPVLRNLLLSMPQRKIVFTNADQAHAHQILNRLGLEDCFDGIICFETLNPPNYTNVPTQNHVLTRCSLFNKDCKPSVEAIEAAIQIADVDPQKTLFFDDSARNIASGKAAGLNTVIVGRSDLVPGADYALNSIHNIKEALPEIWDAEGDQQQMIQSPAVETMVLA